MSWIEIIADRKIRDALEDGAFENLPGKGKPLNLDFDPRVPPEQRVAYRLMKDAQILPDWIQLDKEIRVALERWQARVEQFAQREIPADCNSFVEQRLDREREAFLRKAAEALRDVNRNIDRLNLIVPGSSKQRIRLDIRARMLELEERFPPFAPRRGQAPWEAVVGQKAGPVSLAHRMPLRRRRGSIG